MIKAEKHYNERKEELQKEIDGLEKYSAIIGWSRLIIFIAALYLSYRIYKSSGILSGGICLVIGFCIFAIVALIHGKIINKQNVFRTAIEFNDKGLKRLHGTYREFEDKGEDLLEEDHPFAADLDIFGQNSLFQMINVCRTIVGRKKLGEILSLKRMPDKEEILEKQKAVKELGDKVLYREKFYVKGSFKKKKGKELGELLDLHSKDVKDDSIKLVVAGVFIAITLGFIFAVIAGYISISYLILDFMVNFIVVRVLTGDKSKAIKMFNSTKKSVEAYANVLALIEDENFESSYLNNIKKNLRSNNKSCKEEMTKLVKILDWLGDSGSNAYFFILNILFFADVFIIHNLNRWIRDNGENVEGWLQVLGEFDALSSIANLSFDHDEWCLGEITDEKQVCASKVAHPLIGERAVANNYKLISPNKITLITGSNMSGKSTFLRTVGINLILTYIGAPCCAESFKCSIMNIYTCMRTKDNLEESISSFYAEILRIKLIIEAAKRGEKLFFLLDEIFKGTNSKDRHTGATVLVKQLAANGALGLLSTHDLELCDLEEEMREVENYNFREYYEDNKIKFDYKLRNGRSRTQNAVYLMKLAGIEIEN